MKKLLIILLSLISLTAYSQGVKISAMPQWTDVLDSTWFPIIYNDGTTWTNYRAQGWQIGKERIDSIINNWPTSGSFMRFGYPAEDDNGAEDRDFDQNGYGLTIHDGTFLHGTGAYLAETGAYSILSSYSTGFASKIQTVDNKYSFIESFVGASHWLNLQVGVGSSANYIKLYPTKTVIGLNTEGLFITDLLDSAQAYVLYYNPTYDKVTYGAAPSGGGTAVKANNGLTISSGTADTVQLGSATAGASTFLTNRFIDFSSKYLSITGTVADGFGQIRIANTNGGFALTATSSGDVIQASSTAGAAGSFISTSGTPLTATTTSGAYGIDASVNPTSTNTVKNVLLLGRNSSGTPAIGMGGGIEFSLERVTGGGIKAGQIASVWTDPAQATYTSKMVFSTANNAAFADKFVVYGNGDIEVLTVGAGIILASPDGTRYKATMANGGTWSIGAP